MTPAAFRKLALALPDAVEAPHFELASFRAGGKIFSTLCEKENRAMVKLSPEQQDMLVSAEPGIFERIPNAWGLKGATWMHLDATDAKTAESALRTAHAGLLTKSRPRKTARR